MFCGDFECFCTSCETDVIKDVDEDDSMWSDRMCEVNPTLNDSRSVWAAD